MGLQTASAPATASAPGSRCAHIARRPIVDRHQRVAAYEILGAPVDAARRSSAERDLAVVRALETAGLDSVVGTTLAFLTVGRAAVVDGLVRGLPPDRVVLQFDRTLAVDPVLLDACQALRTAGYSMVLADFVVDDPRQALLPAVTYAKVGFDTAPAGVSVPAGLIGIADGVDSNAAFHSALAAGFTLFQGGWFAQPAPTLSDPIPAVAIGRIRTLQALHDDAVSVGDLEGHIKSDLELCYRTLQAVNSAGASMAVTVTSIRDALLLIGRDRVRRWAALWILASLDKRPHPEVVCTAVVRARCCEVLALESGQEALAPEAFLAGMCSMLDVILHRPMSEVVAALPLAPRIAHALVGGDNVLRRLLDVAMAYERGDWAHSLERLEHDGIDATALSLAYLEALQWVRELQRP